MDLLLGLLGWIACAIFCAGIAGAKGRSAFGWFVLGFLFGPLALLAAAVVPTLDRTPTELTHAHCPACREMIRRDATVCRYCGTCVTPTPYVRRGIVDNHATETVMRVSPRERERRPATA